MKLSEIFKSYQNLRRFVLLIVIILILLQFFRLKIVVGSLTGSVFLSWLKLLDPFALLEIHFASKELNLSAIFASLPIIAFYVIFGRAFCGWICPMDYLFQLVNRLKFSYRSYIAYKISSFYGYIFFLFFLLLSFFFGIPVFTSYFSHLTNFFRALTGIFFLISNLPVDLSLVFGSLMILFLLTILELFLPHFWCRILCPVGKLYGLINKISLLHLSFDKSKCLDCKLCNKSCYMGIDLYDNLNREKLRDINCIYCGKCVDICKHKGKVIKFKIGV